MAGATFQQQPRLTLASALGSFRGALAGTAVMSGMINILALTGSFFMLQVYDRVIPSRSVPTLVA
ncbi:MAG: type I secretion system permease/ATPase, partial [Bradyrhizobium sp.]